MREIQFGVGRVSLADDLRQIPSLPPDTDHFIDGQVIYVAEAINIDDSGLLNKVAKQIAVKLAGLSSQSIDGFEAADIDWTRKSEELLIRAVLDQVSESELPQEDRRAVRVQAERLLTSLLSFNGVRSATTEVADALSAVGVLSGSVVVEIVERNCPVDFLERA